MDPRTPRKHLNIKFNRLYSSGNLEVLQPLLFKPFLPAHAHCSSLVLPDCHHRGSRFWHGNGHRETRELRPREVGDLFDVSVAADKQEHECANELLTWPHCTGELTWWVPAASSDGEPSCSKVKSTMLVGFLWRSVSWLSLPQASWVPQRTTRHTRNAGIRAMAALCRREPKKNDTPNSPLFRLRFHNEARMRRRVHRPLCCAGSCKK